MKGVTIMDRCAGTNALGFDLNDIIVLLGPDAMKSKWTVRDVECLGGPAARRLEDVSDRAEWLDGAEFVVLARDVDQVIDGEFSARLPTDAQDWIIIRSVDSSAYDVFTDREDVMQRILTRFTRVQNIPSEEATSS